MGMSQTHRKNRSRGRSRAGLALVLTCLFLVALPLGGEIYLKEFSSRGAVAFDTTPRDEITRQQPDLIFIGNSMLYTRLEMSDIAEVSGLSAMSLAKGGLASAAWWLQLKNIVVKSAHHPKAVVVFYRDHYLTDPLFRTSEEKYRDKILALIDADADYTAVFPEMQRNFLDRLKSYARFPKLREKVLSPTDMAAWITALEKSSGRKLQKDVNRFFRDAPYRVTDQLDVPKVSAVPKFSEALPGSFLPRMTDLARQNGLTLCFVRVKRRRDVKGEELPLGLADYLQALDEYFEDHRLCHVDMSLDEGITADFFADGDHIKAEMRRRYADILWPKLQKAMQR